MPLLCKYDNVQSSNVTVIEAWMDLVRDEMANKAVKKTLTVPKWLNDLAEASKLNFSHIFQVTLKNRLGIGESSGRISEPPPFRGVREAATRVNITPAASQGYRVTKASQSFAGSVSSKSTNKAPKKGVAKKMAPAIGKKK